MINNFVPFKTKKTIYNDKYIFFNCTPDKDLNFSKVEKLGFDFDTVDGDFFIPFQIFNSILKDKKIIAVNKKNNIIINNIINDYKPDFKWHKAIVKNPFLDLSIEYEKGCIDAYKNNIVLSLLRNNIVFIALLKYDFLVY